MGRQKFWKGRKDWQGREQPFSFGGLSLKSRQFELDYVERLKLVGNGSGNESPNVVVKYEGENSK